MHPTPPSPRPARRGLLLAALAAPLWACGAPPQRLDPGAASGLSRILVPPPRFGEQWRGIVHVTEGGAPTGVAGALVGMALNETVAGATERRHAWVAAALRDEPEAARATFLRTLLGAVQAAGYEPLPGPPPPGAAWDATLETTIEQLHVELNPILGPNAVWMRVAARLLRAGDAAQLMRVTVVNFPFTGSPEFVRAPGAPFEFRATGDRQADAAALRGMIATGMAATATTIAGYLGRRQAPLPVRP
jgi:hypothetical protein